MATMCVSFDPHDPRRPSAVCGETGCGRKGAYPLIYVSAIQDQGGNHRRRIPVSRPVLIEIGDQNGLDSDVQFQIISLLFV